jgi:hypothetical protein
MLNKTALFLTCVLAIACGGYDEDGLETDLAQLQQGFQSVEFDAGFGTRDTIDGLACRQGEPNQTCVIPLKKSLRYLMQSDGADANEVGTVRAQIESWTNAAKAAGLVTQGTDSWSISEAFSDGNSVTHVVIVHADTSNQACNGAGTSSDNIENYACLAGTFIDIEEDSGVDGDYVVRGKTTVHVDLADILAKGSSTNRDIRILRHAVFNAILKGLGRGGGVDGGNALCSSRVLNRLTVDTSCIMQPHEMCILNSFTELLDTENFGYTNQICRLGEPLPSNP